MRKLFTSIILFMAAVCHAANPVVYAASIEPLNWVLDLYVSNLPNAPTNNSNTNFNFGFGSYFAYQQLTTALQNVPTNPTVVVTMTSEGYAANGQLTNFSYSVYGTSAIRRAYPNQTNYDMVSDGSGGMIIRVALSDYIYNTDSNITVSVAGGWYSNNTAAVGVAVTNLTTIPDPPTFLAWSDVPWQRITNTTMTSKAVGFNRSGNGSKPVACVRFVYLDQHGGAITNYQSSMSVDWTTLSPVHAGEYIDTTSISSLTQGDLITRGITAYPLRGTNYADAWSSTLHQPTGGLALTTNLCDKNNALRNVVAVVDITNGSDATGVVVSGPLNTNSPPAPFLSLLGASLAMVKSNTIINSRSNLTDCILYLKKGIYTNVNFTSSQGTNNSAWWTIALYPTNTVGDAAITNNGATSFYSSWKTHIQGLQIQGSGGGYSFRSIPYLWLDQCDIASGSAAEWGNTLLGYATWNKVERGYTGLGFQQFSTENDPWPLVRGNTVLSQQAAGGTFNAMPYCLMENKGPISPIFAGGTTVASTDPAVVYNNLLENSTNLSTGLLNQQVTISNGMAFVQNVVEIATNLTGPAFSICSDGSSGTPMTNVLLWNNTVVGQRVNIFYNDNAANNPIRIFGENIGNLYDDFNTKSDDNITTFNGARTNNWSEFNGVNWSGWYSVKAFAANFLGDWNGINAIYNTNSTPSLLHFINDQSNGNSSSTTNGYGDYHLTTPSVVFAVKQNKLMLPFDIEGYPRGLWDPPGAYSGGNPRRGDFISP
jgi:hypothetical protein